MNAEPATTRGDDTLRVLSCNILAGASITRYHEYFTRSWGAVLPGKYKRGNLDRLADSIGDFDVVGLQEADAGSIRSGFVNQTRYLAEAAGMPYRSHQPNRRLSNFAYTANGLISRTAPAVVLDYPLPGKLGGRGVLLAMFGEDREALTIAVAHLSLGVQSRAQQIDFIADLLRDRPNALLMGDFNCPPDSPQLQALFAHTTLAPPRHPPPTFPSWHPQRAIDHILATSDLRIEHLWTLPAAFSDHLALAAEVRVPNAAWRAAA
jgi:endonuclease/exonuclease/phosphatase family metal-dependent hydrolase